MFIYYQYGLSEEIGSTAALSAQSQSQSHALANATGKASLAAKLASRLTAKASAVGAAAMLSIAKSTASLRSTLGVSLPSFHGRSISTSRIASTILGLKVLAALSSAGTMGSASTTGIAALDADSISDASFRASNITGKLPLSGSSASTSTIKSTLSVIRFFLASSIAAAKGNAVTSLYAALRGASSASTRVASTLGGLAALRSITKAAAKFGSSLLTEILTAHLQAKSRLKASSSILMRVAMPTLYADTASLLKAKAGMSPSTALASISIGNAKAKAPALVSIPSLIAISAIGVKARALATVTMPTLRGYAISLAKSLSQSSGSVGLVSHIAPSLASSSTAAHYTTKIYAISNSIAKSVLVTTARHAFVASIQSTGRAATAARSHVIQGVAALTSEAIAKGTARASYAVKAALRTASHVASQSRDTLAGSVRIVARSASLSQLRATYNVAASLLTASKITAYGRNLVAVATSLSARSIAASKKRSMLKGVTSLLARTSAIGRTKSGFRTLVILASKSIASVKATANTFDLTTLLLNARSRGGSFAKAVSPFGSMSLIASAFAASFARIVWNRNLSVEDVSTVPDRSLLSVTPKRNFTSLIPPPQR